MISPAIISPKLITRMYHEGMIVRLSSPTDRTTEERTSRIKEYADAFVRNNQQLLEEMASKESDRVIRKSINITFLKILRSLQTMVVQQDDGWVYPPARGLLRPDGISDFFDFVKRHVFDDKIRIIFWCGVPYSHFLPSLLHRLFCMNSLRLVTVSLLHGGSPRETALCISSSMCRLANSATKFTNGDCVKSLCAIINGLLFTGLVGPCTLTNVANLFTTNPQYAMSTFVLSQTTDIHVLLPVVTRAFELVNVARGDEEDEEVSCLNLSIVLLARISTEPSWSIFVSVYFVDILENAYFAERSIYHFAPLILAIIGSDAVVTFLVGLYKRAIFSRFVSSARQNSTTHTNKRIDHGTSWQQICVIVRATWPAKVGDTFDALKLHPPKTCTTSVICPITQEKIRSPVVASDGHTYERDAIMEVLCTSTISPLTREPLRLFLFENHAIL